MNNNVISKFQALMADQLPVVVPLIRRGFDKAKLIDFLAPLLLRLYLAPVMWMAGVKKFSHFSATAEWFGNSEWGLGLPAPYVLVFFVALFETLGAICLTLGLATRLMSLPLMVIMIVAGVTAHLKNGWLAIASADGLFATERTREAIAQLEGAKEFLLNQGMLDALNEYGGIVVLNNGIEFATTYFVMLLVLFFTGGGRFVSADYWLVRKYFAQD